MLHLVKSVLIFCFTLWEVTVVLVAAVYVTPAADVKEVMSEHITISEQQTAHPFMSI